MASASAHESVIELLRRRLQQETEERKRVVQGMVLRERQWLHAELEQIAGTVNGNLTLDPPVADTDSVSNVKGKENSESRRSNSVGKRAKRKSLNATEAPSKKKPSIDQADTLPEDLNRLTKEQLLTELRQRGIHLPAKTLKKTLIQALEEAVHESYQEAKKREHARSKSKGEESTPRHASNWGETDDIQAPASSKSKSLVLDSDANQENLPPAVAGDMAVPPTSPIRSPQSIVIASPIDASRSTEEVSRTSLVLEIGKQDRTFSSQVNKEKSSEEMQAFIKKRMQESMSMHKDRRRSQATGLDASESASQQEQILTVDTSCPITPTLPIMVEPLNQEQKQQSSTLPIAAAHPVPATVSSQISKEKSSEAMQALIKNRMQERMSMHKDRRRSKATGLSELNANERGTQQEQTPTVEPSTPILVVKVEPLTNQEQEQQSSAIPTPTALTTKLGSDIVKTVKVENRKTSEREFTTATAQEQISGSDSRHGGMTPTPTNTRPTQQVTVTISADANLSKPSNLVQGLHSLTSLIDPRKQQGATTQDTQAKATDKSQKKAMAVILRAEEAKKQQLLKEEERKKRRAALEKRKKERYVNLKDKPGPTPAPSSSTLSLPTSSKQGLSAGSGVSMISSSMAPAPNTAISRKSGRGEIKRGSTKTAVEKGQPVTAAATALNSKSSAHATSQSSTRESVSSFTKILEKSVPNTQTQPQPHDKPHAPQARTDEPEQLPHKFVFGSVNQPLQLSLPRFALSPASADSNTAEVKQTESSPKPTLRPSAASMRMGSLAFMAPIPEDNPTSVEDPGYDISDKGDSTSDESDEDADQRPKKPIPDWARGAQLKEALDRQFGPDILDPDTIFPQVFTCDLEEVFQMRQKKFSRRTSSANWTLDQLTIVEKRKYKKTMGF